MISSFWNDFLQHVEKSDSKNPIILSLLRQIKPVSMTEEKILLRCENYGVKLYLEKKSGTIEDLIYSFSGKKLGLEITVESKKTKEEPPLLTFQPSPEDSLARAGLNLKYKFDNYAVASTNQVAYAAAQAVAKTPGNSYNPLFLYGGVGVGKTHIAHSVGRFILEHDKNFRVYCCPSDKFLNEHIEAIRERTTARFRKKYRQLNLLIIDDIQFIAGKTSVQEEFFHTFNDIVSAGGQIILTSDRPPTEIKNLEDRLRSRFSGGLIVDIQSPDFELRTAILLIKAKEKNIEIDMEAAKIIAEQVTDVRALEGTLLTLYAKTLGIKERIDLEVVDSFYQEKNNNLVKKISPNDVIKTVGSFYDVKPIHLKGATREDSIALARQIIMYILRKELNLKLEQIAYLLKRKDHTTVMHGIDKIEKLLMKDPNIKTDLNRILGALQLST